MSVSRSVSLGCLGGISVFLVTCILAVAWFLWMVYAPKEMVSLYAMAATEDKFLFLVHHEQWRENEDLLGILLGGAVRKRKITDKRDYLMEAELPGDSGTVDCCVRLPVACCQNRNMRISTRKHLLRIDDALSVFDTVRMTDILTGIGSERNDRFYSIDGLGIAEFTGKNINVYRWSDLAKSVVEHTVYPVPDGKLLKVLSCSNGGTLMQDNRIVVADESGCAVVVSLDNPKLETRYPLPRKDYQEIFFSENRGRLDCLIFTIGGANSTLEVAELNNNAFAVTHRTAIPSYYSTLDSMVWRVEIGQVYLADLSFLQSEGSRYVLRGHLWSYGSGNKLSPWTRSFEKQKILER